AIAPITGFPADDLVPRSAAEVRHVARTDPDRAGAFALAAASEALADAALETRTLDARRVGVALGTTLGGMQLFERWMAGGEPLRAGIEAIPYYGPAVRLARTLGCRGPVATAQRSCWWRRRGTPAGAARGFAPACWGSVPRRTPRT